MDKRPIGVFDSGVGGLTVFREVAATLPHETLIYLGDSARVPYGTKSAETVQRYAIEAARFLVSRDIKTLVVACNTVSAAALPLLREKLEIPVVGVVEPGARAAVSTTAGRIGVIATERTASSRAYSAAIGRIDPKAEVREQACPLFVALAEEGWARTHVAMEVAEVYLGPLLDWGMDTLVLGCTHYPILRTTIQEVVGRQVRVVDSAKTTAHAVAEMLEGKLRTDPATEPRYRFLVTDAAERFRRIAGEFLDHEVDHLELVDLVW